jgi:hypothetical protein
MQPPWLGRRERMPQGGRNPRPMRPFLHPRLSAVEHSPRSAAPTNSKACPSPWRCTGSSGRAAADAAPGSQQSPLRNSRRLGASSCARRCRWRNFISRRAVLLTPMPCSSPRSKALRRRRNSRRSKRRNGSFALVARSAISRYEGDARFEGGQGLCSTRCTPDGQFRNSL